MLLICIQYEHVTHYGFNMKYSIQPLFKKWSLIKNNKSAYITCLNKQFFSFLIDFTVKSYVVKLQNKGRWK